MRRAILLLSVALCGCGADDQMRVLDTTPEGIEAWAWTQAYSKQAMTEHPAVKEASSICTDGAARLSDLLSDFGSRRSYKRMMPRRFGPPAVAGRQDEHPLTPR